jgi:hypothetical protein
LQNDVLFVHDNIPLPVLTGRGACLFPATKVYPGAGIKFR